MQELCTRDVDIEHPGDVATMKSIKIVKPTSDMSVGIEEADEETKKRRSFNFLDNTKMNGVVQLTFVKDLISNQTKPSNINKKLLDVIEVDNKVY